MAGPDVAPPGADDDDLDLGGNLALLTAALAELPDATLMVFDRDLRYRMVRGGALPDRDFSACALEGRLARDVLGPEWWEFCEPAYRAALAGERRSLEVRSPDGERVFNVNVSPLHGHDGDVIGGVSTAVDITDQQRFEKELIASEAQFRLLAENASDVVVQTDPHGVVSWVSPSVERVLGWPVDAIVGANARDLIVAADRDEVGRRISDLDADHPEDEMECRVRTEAGGRRWMAVRVGLITAAEDGAKSFVFGLRDVTDEVVARAERDQREVELVQTLDSSPDAILRVGADLRITFVNRVVHAGFPGIDLVGKGLVDIGLPDESVATWDERLDEVLATGGPTSFEVQGRESIGSPWWDVRIAPSLGPDGDITHLTVMLRDITVRKGAERELFMAATHDPLTGLANRAEVLSEIERALSAATRSTHSTGVLMVDLDHFKLVNDSLGHAVGDKLLIAAAQRLGSLVRSGDMAGRLGGDEFVIVMRDLDDPTEAARVGERVVNGFREPLTVGDLALLTTASVGLTVAGPIDPVAPTPTTLLREADTALYRAKSSGRDSLAFFNDVLRSEVAERMRVEEALRHALERDELELWYQPEIDLTTGAVDAVEALLRWHHPSGEILPAGRFIEIAEDAGLIVAIGDWVIHQACAQAAAWAALRPDQPLTVRINLSAAQLSEVGLLDELGLAVEASGVDPTVICLEITEAALLHDLPTAQVKLRAIRERGISIAVDAFGTGDSSIRCLRECEIDVLKIDPSLATALTDTDDRRLVAGVLALARTLGLPVTAKGIETPAQADLLRSLGCESGQGWLFSHAVEPERIDELILVESMR